MERYLWKFHWDCGRSGDLHSLFVATEQEVKDLVGRDANFGEVLGKHSEVYGTIQEGEITKVDLDTETVEKVSKVLGDIWSGYNPMDYTYHQCSKCEERYMGMEFDTKKGICSYCAADELSALTDRYILHLKKKGDWPMCHHATSPLAYPKSLSRLMPAYGRGNLACRVT